jgi:hypothetical protein
LTDRDSIHRSVSVALAERVVDVQAFGSPTVRIVRSGEMALKWKDGEERFG